MVVLNIYIKAKIVLKVKISTNGHKPLVSHRFCGLPVYGGKGRGHKGIPYPYVK